MIKRPPDKYTTIKCSLKHITKNKNDELIISDAVRRTNKIIIHTYQFLRLWILDKYSKNEEIPLITKDVIRMAFKTLTVKTKDPKGENLKILNEFNTFYNDEYKKLNYKLDQKISAKHLTQVLNFATTEIITSIENNVKNNFLNYVRRFVNSSFKKQNDEEKEKIKDKEERKKITKELKKEMGKIKNDLLKGTNTASNKYNEWITIHYKYIFPESYKNLNDNDINNNPQKYLKNMIYMCRILEKNENKMFQFFPLRTEITPKYISIDTRALLELFFDDANSYFNKISEYKDELWEKMFNIKQKIRNHYIFDYKLSTDGFAVSLQMLHVSFIEITTEKKRIRQRKNKETKTLLKTMNEEEKIKYNKDKEKNKIKQKEEQRLKRMKIKEDFKKLSKEEKEKVIKIKKENEFVEFPYLEELNENQFEQLKNANKVYIDPGKRNLLYMMNDKGTTLRYSNKEKLHNTKQLKYKRIIENHKKENKIDIIENILSKYNSKSCVFNNFAEFIKKKNEINEDLFEKYENDKFRKYKWYSYINKQKNDQKIINKIEETFGKNIKIIYGDWSIGKQMRNFIPTPNIRIKRNIGRHFDTYSLDEFRSSVLNYLTEEKNDNLFLTDKTGEIREIHSILTYKMENRRLGCINRDYNAVKNYKKLTDYYLKYKDRPEKYKRSFKFE